MKTNKQIEDAIIIAEQRNKPIPNWVRKELARLPHEVRIKIAKRVFRNLR